VHSYLIRFLGPTGIPIQNDISNILAIFAQLTAELPCILQWAALSPSLKIVRSHGDQGTYLIHDFLGPSEPTTQTASRSIQLFLHSSPQCPHTLQWSATSPSKLPLPTGDLERTHM